ncbi:hypothetical protein B296_00055826 [Ensete ventricosum]|uniref:Uncharacterized protein n=1 Tax=Ensete ventricosum TaxID=4639 RepID=A0A426X4J3_ENSVE|nr:hypothetical protein B296_00055826 [Ensete ventricosum]
MPPPSSSSSFTAAVAAPALYARRQVRRFFSSDSRLRPRADRRRGWWPLALAFTAQGPCCLYIGPVETASKEMLEALYQQVAGTRTALPGGSTKNRQSISAVDGRLREKPIVSGQFRPSAVD